MVYLFVLALTLVVDVPAAVGQATGVEVREISRSRVTAAGQPLVLPGSDVEVIASEYTIAPGAALPVHKHRYPRYAYVLSGEVQVTADDGRVFRYGPGEFVVEMVDVWHRGSNVGTAPARLLVIDQVQGGGSNTVLQDR